MITQVQVKSQTRIAVAEFTNKLRANERLTQNVVIKVMNQIFGDSASGKWHCYLIQELYIQQQQQRPSFCTWYKDR